MSDIMTSVPFRKLLDWVLREKEEKGTIFGVRRPYEADPSETVQIFGRKLETPVSYTHLDVYKRQQTDRGVFGWFSSSRLNALMALLIMPTWGPFPWTMTTSWPVSYTHLDVYKRQRLRSESFIRRSISGYSVTPIRSKRIRKNRSVPTM